MSRSTHYRSFREQFYRSNNPTNSVITLKNNGQSTRSRANHTRLSSLQVKKCNTNFIKYNSHITMKTKVTEVLGRQRVKPSKIKACAVERVKGKSE